MTKHLQAVAAPPIAVYQTANVLVFPTRWQLCIIEIISRGTYATAFTDLTHVKNLDGKILNRDDIKIVGIIR